jgi:hypothetical protein
LKGSGYLASSHSLSATLSPVCHLESQLRDEERLEQPPVVCFGEVELHHKELEQYVRNRCVEEQTTMNKESTKEKGAEVGEVEEKKRGNLQHR